MKKPLIKNIKAGSDPEVFVVSPAGEIVPVFDLIGGSKHNPRPMGKPGFFVQEDNAAIEFNIPASKTKEEFVENIFEGMRLAKTFLPEGYDLRAQASARFTPAQLDHPKAHEFGCESDKNAWTGDYNDKPEVPSDGLRSTGLHFHIGYDLVDANGPYMVSINQMLAQWCDLYLGVPSMKLDPDMDRRRLYGKAGAYRDKSYGMEYRVLSSKPLEKKEYIEWMYSQGMRAVEMVNKHAKPDNLDMPKVLAAINGGDKKAMEYLVEKYDLKYA